MATTSLFAVAAPVSAEDRIHTVEAGETLTAISARYDVAVGDLADPNGLDDPDVVRAGEELVVPETPRTHLVAAGETLWRVALRYDTTVAALMDANDLADTVIVAGRRLVVPGSSPAPADETGADRDDVDDTGFGGAPGSGTDEDAGDGPARVLITPSGVVAPILADLGDGSHRIRTPCGADVVVRGGRPVGRVDVVLDPGHGGSESGSVGPNGLVERDLNLAVAERAAELLRDRGYAVGLTRTVDHYLPIAGRAAIVVAWQPDLFVSIHHNGGEPGPSAEPGTQVSFQHADPESRRAAGLLYEELRAAALAHPTAWVGNSADGVSARLGATGDDFYGALRMTQGIPSALSEFLWISNGPEAALLATDDVQEAEATAIADGVERWFATDDPGSGYIGTFTDTYDAGAGGLVGCTDPRLG